MFKEQVINFAPAEVKQQIRKILGYAKPEKNVELTLTLQHDKTAKER
jgi:hypothetical protein